MQVARLGLRSKCAVKYNYTGIIGQFSRLLDMAF